MQVIKIANFCKQLAKAVKIIAEIGITEERPRN